MTGWILAALVIFLHLLIALLLFLFQSFFFFFLFFLQPHFLELLFTFFAYELGASRVSCVRHVEGMRVALEIIFLAYLLMFFVGFRIEFWHDFVIALQDDIFIHEGSYCAIRCNCFAQTEGLSFVRLQAMGLHATMTHDYLLIL